MLKNDAISLVGCSLNSSANSSCNHLLVLTISLYTENGDISEIKYGEYAVDHSGPRLATVGSVQFEGSTNHSGNCQTEMLFKLFISVNS